MRFENLAQPARRDLGDEDRGRDPEREGDQHGTDGDDERASDERQDAEIIFNGIPADGEQVAEFDFGERGQAFFEQKDKRWLRQRQWPNTR